MTFGFASWISSATAERLVASNCLRFGRGRLRYVPMLPDPRFRRSAPPTRPEAPITRARSSVIWETLPLKPSGERRGEVHEDRVGVRGLVVGSRRPALSAIALRIGCVRPDAGRHLRPSGMVSWKA